MRIKGRFRCLGSKFSAFLLTMLLAVSTVAVMAPASPAALAEEGTLESKEIRPEAETEEIQQPEETTIISEAEDAVPADDTGSVSISDSQEASGVTAGSDSADEEETEGAAAAADKPMVLMSGLESEQKRDSREAFSVTVTVYWHDFGHPSASSPSVSQRLSLFRQHPDRPEDTKKIGQVRLYMRGDEAVSRETWESSDYPDLLQKPEDSDKDYIYFAKQGYLDEDIAPGPFGYIADESGLLELHNYNSHSAVGGINLDLEYIRESTGEQIPIDKTQFLYLVEKIPAPDLPFFPTRAFGDEGSVISSLSVFNTGVLNENKEADALFRISQLETEQAHVNSDKTFYYYGLTYMLEEDAESPSGQKLVLKESLITHRGGLPGEVEFFTGMYPKTLLFSNSVKEGAKGTIRVHKVMRPKQDSGGGIIVGSYKPSVASGSDAAADPSMETGSAASSSSAAAGGLADMLPRNGSRSGAPGGKRGPGGEFVWPKIPAEEAGVIGCPGDKSFAFELWREGDSEAMESFTLPNEDGSWTKTFSDLELGTYKVVEVLEDGQDPPLSMFADLHKNMPTPPRPPKPNETNFFELTELHSVADVMVQNTYFAPRIVVKKAWPDLKEDDLVRVGAARFQLYRYPLGHEDEVEEVGLPHVLRGVDEEGYYYAQWDGKYIERNPATGRTAMRDLECFKTVRENDQTYNIPYVYFVEEVPAPMMDPETGELNENWPFVTYKDEGGFTLTNYYKKSFDLEAEKVFAVDPAGKTKLPLQGNEFSFELYEDGSDEPLMVVSNDAAGKILFSDVPGPEKVGEEFALTYRIKEKEGTLSDVTYSEQVYEAKVYYTVNPKSEELETHVDYYLDSEPAEKAAFVNVLNLETRLSLTAEKILEGRELQDQEFSFELWQGDEKIAEAKNTADGKITFPELVFTGEDLGEQHYLIKEKSGAEEGMSYDEKVFAVTVTISQEMDSAGKPILKALSDPEEPPVFVNKYEKPTEPTKPTEPSKPTEPTEPTEATDPVKPTDPTKARETVKPSKPQPAETKEAAKTGESPRMLPFLSLALAAAAVAVRSIYKRKREI